MKGEDGINTAMAKLVGLPLGIFAKLLLDGKIESKGVHIPVMKEVYEPVLEELKEYGVVFEDQEIEL
jgi:saccharopine dehydrogenase (NADP+, L-glutamate forming)